MRFLSLDISFVQCVIYRSRLLCTMRYLSLSISFVQCVIYREGRLPRPGEDQLYRRSTRRGSTLPTIHSARINSADDPLREDQLCRRSSQRQRVYIACHFSTFISFCSSKYILYSYLYDYFLSATYQTSASNLSVSKRPPLPQLPSLYLPSRRRSSLRCGD